MYHIKNLQNQIFKYIFGNINHITKILLKNHHIIREPKKFRHLRLPNYYIFKQNSFPHISRTIHINT